MKQPLTPEELAQLRDHLQEYGAEMRAWFNALTDTSTKRNEFDAREHVARLCLFLLETTTVLEVWGERLNRSTNPARSAGAPD